MECALYLLILVALQHLIDPGLVNESSPAALQLRVPIRFFASLATLLATYFFWLYTPFCLYHSSTSKVLIAITFFFNPII